MFPYASLFLDKFNYVFVEPLGDYSNICKFKIERTHKRFAASVEIKYV